MLKDKFEFSVVFKYTQTLGISCSRKEDTLTHNSGELLILNTMQIMPNEIYRANYSNPEKMKQGTLKLVL